ncbi:hypothetical protein WJX73_000755 [Symbiochloris irregularis]|uniref:Uncharacterized protein n=1 Tax=Symbiochloris irregularis TaxID=706552 RepID=A0AAW1P1B9_9CHLO
MMTLAVSVGGSRFAALPRRLPACPNALVPASMRPACRPISLQARAAEESGGQQHTGPKDMPNTEAGKGKAEPDEVYGPFNMHPVRDFWKLLFTGLLPLLIWLAWLYIKWTFLIDWFIK